MVKEGFTERRAATLRGPRKGLAGMGRGGSELEGGPADGKEGLVSFLGISRTEKSG